MAGPPGLSRFIRRAAQPGHEDLGPYLNRVIWSLAALSGLFLALRLYCKRLRRRQLWWDDYILVASWIALVVSTSLQTVSTTYGLGRHYQDLDPDSIMTESMYNIPAGFCSILATCWSKTAFALSLLRISEGRMRKFIWFIIVTVNLVLGSNGVIQWVQCWPVAKQWNWYMPGTCFDPKVVQNFNTFVAAYSGLMDIVLALVPWKIIWTVTINKREKIGALLAMSTGVLAGIIAFLKIKTLYVIGDDDATNVDLFIFGTAEPATAIMAASMPILRALIRKDHHPRPAEFIELANNNRARPSPPPPEHELHASDDNNGTGGETDVSPKDSWAKVVHHERARHVREGSVGSWGARGLTDV